MSYTSMYVPNTDVVDRSFSSIGVPVNAMNDAFGSASRRLRANPVMNP